MVSVFPGDLDCKCLYQESQKGGPPGWGDGIGLVLFLGLNVVRAPANGNEMLVFHGIVAT